jgi:ArsR family transcriptional regulator, arsenate/arsenite/antimonite-responsive transcriptional repressor
MRANSQHIDKYLSIIYTISMTTRLRPPACCELALPPVPVTDEQRLVWLAAFRALSDATRLQIMLLLAAQTEPLCACDVGDQFELSQPTISHHMKVLVDAGLVDSYREGIWAFYRLTDIGRGLMAGALGTLAPGVAGCCT